MAYRRIAYHRSWFMIVVGAIGLALVIGFCLDFDWRMGVHDDAIYVPVLLGPLALLFIVRGLTGEWGKRQLRVDVAAGKLMLPDGSLHDLDELGALTIDKKALPRRRGPRPGPQLHEYLLRAANLKYYLFDSVYESETKIRYHAVDAVVLESRVRRILERPASDGSAFRSGPDALAEIMAAAETPERARAALRALARDADPYIRDQAKALAAAVPAATA